MPATSSPLLDRLHAIVGSGALLASPSELVFYECDGYTTEKNKPDVVVFPTTTEQIVQIVQACNEFGVPFLPRGAGTSLAGGCLPVGGGVMIALTRMKRILEVNVRDRYAVVEAGVVNVWLTNALKPHGYHYAPDPSSQGACTIGGNVATNSGGPHTLKYGVTVNHVLGVEAVLADGTVPAALEMMDQGILVAVEAAFQFGFPLDAQAILLIEVDGLEAGLDQQRDQIIEICKKCGAREVRLARDEKERLKLWKCRKQAFGAIGRLSPSYCTQDGVVPRTKLPHILRKIISISHKYDIRIVNVFHAGDGNIHPILLFDERDAAQVRRVLAASNEILDECLACGGSVTGEHGIGVEKIGFMSKMFTPTDLAAMGNLRDAFNPQGNLSPDKMLPTAGGCGMEQKHPGRRAAL